MEHASSSSKEDDDLGMMRRGGTFTFDFVIATSYPHDAPKVKCKTKVQLETPQSNTCVVRNIAF